MKIVTKEESADIAKGKESLQTACWDCIFSSPQNNDNENLNDYCSTGRLEALQNAGAEIMSVDSEQKNKNFKIVGNRICNMFRTEAWKKIRIKRGQKEEDLEKMAREEIKIKCTYALYVADSLENPEASRKETKDRLSQIAATMKEMWDSEIRPTNIVIVNNTWIKPYDFINYLRIEINRLGFNPMWTMEYIKRDGENIKNLKKPDAFGKCMDIIIKTDTSNSQYFALFFEGGNIRKDYLSQIDKSINEEMNRFLVLFPEKEEDGGLFIQRMAYKQFYGNRDENFTEKLKKGAKEQKCQNLIQPLKKILKTQ